MMYMVVTVYGYGSLQYVHFIFMLLSDYQFDFFKVEWCFTFPIVNLHARLFNGSKPGLEP